MCSAKVSRQSRSSPRQENPRPRRPCPRPRPRWRSGARPGSRWWPGLGWRPAPPSPPPPTSRVCRPRLPTRGRRSGSAASRWSSSWSPHSVCNSGQKMVSSQQNTLGKTNTNLMVAIRSRYHPIKFLSGSKTLLFLDVEVGAMVAKAASRCWRL